MAETKVALLRNCFIEPGGDQYPPNTLWIVSPPFAYIIGQSSQWILRNYNYNFLRVGMRDVQERLVYNVASRPYWPGAAGELCSEATQASAPADPGHHTTNTEAGLGRVGTHCNHNRSYSNNNST